MIDMPSCRIATAVQREELASGLSRRHRIGSNEYFNRGWGRPRYCNIRCWLMSALGH